MNTASIRARLSVLIILSALPAFAVAIYNGIERYRHAESAARSQTLNTAAVAAAGVEAGMVLSGADARSLQEVATRIPLPQAGKLAILNKEGLILAAQPAATRTTGVRETNDAVIEALQSGGSEPFIASDADGTRRLYAVRSARRNPDGDAALYVVVSMPAQEALSEANSALLQTFLGVFLASLALLYGAWKGVELAMLRRLRTLLAVTNHIRAGDLTARTRFPAGEEELSQLGHALDDMAQALQKRDADLKQALRELGEQVITDPLTKLNNRRYLWDFLGRDLIRARRAVLPVAAILFDIDHFKRFNDTWGHEAGDLVLKSVADVIRQNVRGSDIACRYGGEEFIIVLSEATRTVAVQRAETIRRDIEGMDLALGDKPLDRVTASFGVALYPTHADNAEALVRAADDALYQAKENGRNRVQVFEAAPSLL
ncbi:MAG: sensor domain-containing diguanylate cyclase [Betaproteobacteria bacterium]